MSFPGESPGLATDHSPTSSAEIRMQGFSSSVHPLWLSAYMCIKVKVNFSREQNMNAQKGSRSIDLIFL